MSNYFIPQKNQINTVLAEGTQLNGYLSFSTSLEIKGQFKGIIFSKGLLIIAKTASIEATIYSENLVVNGKVQGNIIVNSHLEVTENATIIGDIKTHKIKISDGVFFEGDCSTLPQEELAPLFLEGAKNISSRKVESPPEGKKVNTMHPHHLASVGSNSSVNPQFAKNKKR